MPSREPCSNGMEQVREIAMFAESFVGCALATLQRWMAAESTCSQLGAAGYAPQLQAVLQQLLQLLAAHKALKDSPSDTAAVLIAAQQLKSTGLALCSFAVPCICNNPGCATMSGLSELASVSGRSCICAGCHVARYCGRACQRQFGSSTSRCVRHSARLQQQLLAGALGQGQGW